MRIPEEIRKTVAFICYRKHSTQELVPVSSCFYLGHDPREGAAGSPRAYVITAKHVIDALRRKGVSEIFLRLNVTGQPQPLGAVQTSIEDWYSHPTDKSVDVAICKSGLPAVADHRVLPFFLCATEQVYKDHAVDLGDEVVITGLFRHHFGKSKNIPIVRIGNLAALDEEKVATKDFGEMDAYLIEARSIGGLSGSPVFLNLGNMRAVGATVKIGASKDPIFFLIGLIHGHYDVKTSELASTTPDPDDLTDEKINSGIAIVVPIRSIRAVISEYEKTDPL